MVTLQDCYDYIGIDEADEMVERNVTRCMKTADRALIGSLGENYPKDDPRVDELKLAIVDDLYSQRGLTSNKVSANVRKMINDFEFQIRAEMKKGTPSDAV